MTVRLKIMMYFVFSFTGTFLAGVRNLISTSCVADQCCIKLTTEKELKKEKKKKTETKIEEGMANKAFFLSQEEICFFLLCRFIFHQNSVGGCMPWKDFIFHLCFFFQTAGQNCTSGKGWRAARGRLMTGYLVPLSFKCASVNT